MRRAAITTSDETFSRGGISRYADIVKSIAEELDLEVKLIAPKSAPSKFKAIRDVLSIERQLDIVAPDLLITNSNLTTRPHLRIPRIHVYHNTAVGRSECLSTKRSAPLQTPIYYIKRRRRSHGRDWRLSGCSI